MSNADMQARMHFWAQDADWKSTQALTPKYENSRSLGETGRGGDWPSEDTSNCRQRWWPAAAGGGVVVVVVVVVEVVEVVVVLVVGEELSSSNFPIPSDPWSVCSGAVHDAGHTGASLGHSRFHPSPSSPAQLAHLAHPAACQREQFSWLAITDFHSPGHWTLGQWPIATWSKEGCTGANYWLEW